MIITLDGPCGSGKSTLAQLLAQKLGFFYINSGYLYRALAYLLVHKCGYDAIKLQNPDLQDITYLLHQKNFVYKYEDGIAQVFFQGQNITDYLKSADVSRDASIISSYPHVRQAIVPVQQYFATLHDLVTDGRDCGTEIYPQAQFKFYVTAAPEIRTERLLKDLERKGVVITFDEVLQTTIARDQRDMQRASCPLKKADDAIEVDTSNRSIEEALEFMMQIIYNVSK
jgi:CMP/dCMP kinase